MKNVTLTLHFLTVLSRTAVRKRYAARGIKQKLEVEEASEMKRYYILEHWSMHTQFNQKLIPINYMSQEETIHSSPVAPSEEV